MLCLLVRFFVECEPRIYDDEQNRCSFGDCSCYGCLHQLGSLELKKVFRLRLIDLS